MPVERRGRMRHDSLRLAGFDYRGRHLYFLTYCTFQRTPVFSEKTSVEIVHPQILRAAAAERIHISAYCYMPDHLHLIAAGQDDETDGRAFIAKSKQLSGFEFRRRTGRHLWQRYAYDRLIKPDTLLTVVRYVLGNPVAAGLVETAMDYPFSGSEVWDRPTLELFMKGYVKPKVGSNPPSAIDRAG